MAQSTFIKKKPKMYTFNVRNLKRASMPGLHFIGLFIQGVLLNPSNIAGY